ncbi:MAG: fimbrillin family protein [Rikenellaceae bacterium]
MKREHLLIAVAALVAVTNCTKEEATVSSASQSQSQSDVINLVANTTRAQTMELSDLMGDTTGFVVYATYTDTSSDAWLIEGDSYIYDDTTSEWGWSDVDYAWPTDTDKYPVVFYSVYANDMDGVTTTPATELSTTTPLTASIVIAAPDSQIDLLATATSTETKPSSGKLAITFDHVLSKIDFGIIPGLDKMVYVAAFSLGNLEDEGDYDLQAASWSITSTTGDALYPLSDFSALDNVVGDETTATSLTNTASEDSFMLLPQTTTVWDAENWGGVIDSISNTYIDMLYRATYDSDTSADGESYIDYIGYTLAQDHPSYDSTNPDHTKYYDMALFIRAGYPLSSTWDKMKNYTYNIKIGTEDATNGYLLDDVYYDEDGVETPFEVDLDKEIGDLISDGNIHFDVNVSIWDDEGNTSTIN